MNRNRAAVIIPVYRSYLTELEQISFHQCNKVLGSHPIIIIKPANLKLFKGLSTYHTICFDDKYFENIQGYNRLMLSEEFYKSLINYEYILIAQLDTFVFRDDLVNWCDKDYDYIGAPWLHRKEYNNLMKAKFAELRSYVHVKLNIKMKRSFLPSSRQFENKVGNGGFSLRRVEKFLKICHSFSSIIEKYNQIAEHQFHEDTFWSIEVNRKKTLLKIPNVIEALGFAYENFPERAHEMNKLNLPFGCHAWDKNLSFWRPFLELEGYSV